MQYLTNGGDMYMYWWSGMMHLLVVTVRVIEFFMINSLVGSRQRASMNKLSQEALVRKDILTSCKNCIF